jgi:hypothetical protein
MLHATATTSAPVQPEQHAEPEPLVEPAPPQPEPVQAFVQNLPGGMEESEPVSASADLSFVAAPIQDDLLPQLPRRTGRRHRGDTPAPAVPAQVLRIAAAQTGAEPAEPVVAHIVDDGTPSHGAPPLPRRELDAEPMAAAPARREPAQVQGATDQPRPNYELFAAFRAATDQGRADAVRRGDGGGS